MFSHGLGLKVNLTKSNLYGVGVPVDEIQGWASMLGCGSEALAFSYLGPPVGASMRRTSHWAPVIEKLKDKLSAWKTRWISFGGRWTFVKSVLGSVSLYYLSLFHASVRVLRELEMVRSKIFWGGGSGEEDVSKRGFHWLTWDKVLGSFVKGV